MFDYLAASMLEIGRHLVAEGFTVLGNEPQKKTPGHKWKHLQDRQPTDKELQEWFQKHDWKPGIITGKLSGIVVFDCDDQAAVEWAKANMPETPLRVVSGSGKGMHFYYRMPDDLVTNARSAWVLPPRSELAADIRGEGGQVLAPGALHKSGNRYRLDEGSLPLCRATIAQLPLWPSEQLAPPPPPPRATAPPAKDRLDAWSRAKAYMANWEPAVAGQGGDTATFANACALVRGFELSDQEAMDLLLGWNQMCRPPWTENELWAKVLSARSYGRKPFGYLLNEEPSPTQKAYAQVLRNRTKTSPDEEPPPHPWQHHRTELGNAELLIQLFGQDIRYSHEAHRWWWWSGKQWEKDNAGQVLHLANQVARARQQAAFEIEDEEDRKAELKWAFGSESRSKRDNTLAQAISLPGMTLNYEDLDPDPWILGCANGTLDLRTGQLRPHAREDLGSQLVPIAYDPNAHCPLWEAFLDRIMGRSQAMIGFLQRAIGYSLTGSTREQVLFILHGSGRNGKSVFLEVVLALLGSYAQAASPSTFLAKDSNSDGIRNDIARLRGARFVKSVETDSGRRLDEGLVKQVTGGDKMLARFLREEFFEFTPRLKLWLATNHKPDIRGQDMGIWRRIRLLPFRVTIPEAEIDLNLQEALLKELPGILAWAVRGCLEWQRMGLQEPAEVLAATADYKDEQDALGKFFEDCCVVGSGLRVGAHELYSAYRDWAGKSALSQVKFGSHLGERGFEHKRTKSARLWVGLGLRATNVAEPGPLTAEECAEYGIPLELL